MLLLLGLVLIAGGIWEISSRKTFSGIVNLAIGGILVLFPNLSVVALTFLVAISLLAIGIYRLKAAQPKVGGILTMILGILLALGWPFSGLYAIGLFISIQLAISGLILAAKQPFSQTEPAGAYLTYASDIKPLHKKQPSDTRATN